MSSEELTARQQSVFHFIKNNVIQHGYGPTIREICDEFKIKSPNGVICHLKALQKKGLIRRTANKSRAIELVGGPLSHTGLPLRGVVAAGKLNESVPTKGQRIDFTGVFDAPGRYVLQIKGNSMVGARIQDGDYVVISPADSADDGEIVVAQTDAGETTLKYWFKERDHIRLQPANHTMSAILVNNVRVVGKVVGVVRPIC